MNERKKEKIKNKATFNCKIDVQVYNVNCIHTSRYQLQNHSKICVNLLNMWYILLKGCQCNFVFNSFNVIYK